jgi:hypothetical protein
MVSIIIPFGDVGSALVDNSATSLIRIHGRCICYLRYRRWTQTPYVY